MLDPGEDFFHGARYNTSMRVAARVLETLHSMRLTCSSLTICKNGGIVAFQDRANCMLGCTIIDMLLTGIHIVDLIEAVGMPH